MSFKVLISLPLLLAFLSLGGCALFDEISPRVLPGSQGAQNARAQEKAKTVSLELYTLENPPEWARTESGVSLRAGGFSGLFFLGKTSAGEYQFMTHTDRGLVGEPLKLPAIGDDVRPFIIPQFQPRWVMLETSHQTSSLKIVKEILLTDPKGQPLTGLPLIHTDGDKFSDEKPVDLAGKLLPMDLGGIDPEGLTRDADGNFWMCEEYRPSILKFSPSGKLIKRFVPKNSFTAPQLAALDKKWGAGHLVANLPEEYRYRRPNRGFEGITFQDGKIYATLQSPLDIPSALHKKKIGRAHV